MPTADTLLGPGGALAALLLTLTAIKLGWLASRQEVEAWKGRAERAEKQADILMSASASVLAERGRREPSR